MHLMHLMHLLHLLNILHLLHLMRLLHLLHLMHLVHLMHLLHLTYLLNLPHLMHLLHLLHLRHILQLLHLMNHLQLRAPLASPSTSAPPLASEPSNSSRMTFACSPTYISSIASCNLVRKYSQISCTFSASVPPYPSLLHHRHLGHLHRIFEYFTLFPYIMPLIPSVFLAHIFCKNSHSPTLQCIPHLRFFDHTAKTKYRNFETNIPRKGISGSQSQFPHSCFCERFIYSHHRSPYSAGGNM